MYLFPILAATVAVGLLPFASAITLDPTSETSIKIAASDIAHGMMQFYTGNETGQIPGLLPGPYYWWEAGAMMGALMDYYYYTGDDTYNEEVIQGMLWQASPTDDYMPQNQTKDLGNDDQVFWGFAAMTAAEYVFPNPPKGSPQWLGLAQGVWNSQQLRWDTSSCAGGLRWQIYPFNAGYDYKNSPSNAGFVNLGARLYSYTDNQTYADWTVKVWDWMADIGLIGGYRDGQVFDGTSTPNNCSTTDQILWTYSAGMLLNAAAVMWNKTQNPLWETRVMDIWAACIVFFPNETQTMVEVACEPYERCDTDELSFKAYLARFMAASTKVMPQLTTMFQPYLLKSAQNAALQCSGTVAGIYGDACGLKWYEGRDWDGTYGVGQQMAALEVIQGLLIGQAAYPVSKHTGGISHGDPSAGTGGDGGTLPVGGETIPMQQVTTADKAGAGVLTAVLIIFMLGGTWWMI